MVRVVPGRGAVRDTVLVGTLVPQSVSVTVVMAEDP